MRKLQMCILAGCLPVAAWAQPGINSIYSAYGIGDVNIRDWNANTAMGGLGIAMKSDKTLNSLNPASYSTINKGKYMFELSFSGRSLNYINETQNVPAKDLTLNGASLGFNIVKNWGMAIGLKRYSAIDYKTTASRYIIGTNTKLDETIEGTGGLNQAYWGNGFQITKGLSLGVTGGFIWGSANRKENIYTSSTEGLVIEQNTFYNKLYVNAGLQYQFKTGGLSWTLGGTFQPGMNLNKTQDSYIKDMADATLLEDKGRVTAFKYPLQMGGGITVQKGASTLGFDYIQQNWSSTGYKGTGFRTTNLQNFALGYKHTWQRKTPYGWLDGPSLMAGIQQDLSYIIINNRQVKTLAGSVGAILPSKNGMYNYTLALRYGERGNAIYPMVKEKFVDLTLNVSLAGFFYLGGRKYD